MYVFAHVCEKGIAYSSEGVEATVDNSHIPGKFSNCDAVHHPVPAFSQFMQNSRLLSYNPNYSASTHADEPGAHLAGHSGRKWKRTRHSRGVCHHLCSSISDLAQRAPSET
jgi:hypothetical protein